MTLPGWTDMRPLVVLVLARSPLAHDPQYVGVAPLQKRLATADPERIEQASKWRCAQRQECGAGLAGRIRRWVLGHIPCPDARRRVFGLADVVAEQMS
jgi:hypothetical protein